MKFVADVMLGRLARWMRFAGYDVEYDRAADDDHLLRRSRWRTLLTRDRALAQRARPDRVYFVQSTGAGKQMAEMLARFPSASGSPRCLVCNHVIRRIRKERIRHLVPPYVYEKHRVFFRCGGCNRVYWRGTHFEHLSRMIE